MPDDTDVLAERSVISPGTVSLSDDHLDALERRGELRIPLDFPSKDHRVIVCLEYDADGDDFRVTDSLR